MGLEICGACWQPSESEDMGTLIPPKPVRRFRICRNCINSLWHEKQPIAIEQREAQDGRDNPSPE